MNGWARAGALLAAFAFSVGASNAAAAELPGDTQSLPCRPTIACTAEFVPPGALEIETGILTRRLAGDARQVSFPVLAKLTVASWAQLQLGSNGLTELHGSRPARYVDNVSVGAKLHLVDQSTSAPSVSFAASASVPTVAQEGYARAYDATTIAYASKDIGLLHVDLNLGLNLVGVDSTPTAQEWCALALSMPLPRPFGAMIENYYFSDGGPLAPRDGGLLFAISHNPAPWVVFDAGADVGYFPAARSLSVFVGATVVPALLWRASGRIAPAP